MTTDRPQLLTSIFLASAADGVHSEPCNVKGCALEVHVRNDGRSMLGYFRYRGLKLGDKTRVSRVPLGSLDLGLPYLRRECVTCEDLIRQGLSPKQHRGAQKEKQQAATRTVRVALNEYFAWAGGDDENPPALWKSPET